MKFHKIKIKIQVLILVLLVAVIGSVFVIVHDYKLSTVDYDALVDDKLSSVIVMAKTFVGDDYHDLIIDENSVSNEDFSEIVNKYNMICVALDLEYIWSVMLVGDTAVFTTSTSPDKNIDNMKHAKFFEVHSDQELYENIFTSGKKVRRHIDGKWGNIESLLIPYVDSKGRSYLFGAALKSSNYKDFLSNRIKERWINDLLFMAAIVLLCYIFIIWLIKPLTFITSNIQKIATGEYDFRKARWAQEYIKLSDSIHFMYTQINESYNTISIQEKDLKTTLMSIGDGVIVTNAKGEVTRINKEATKLTGWNEEDAKGEILSNVFNISDSRISGVGQAFDELMTSRKIVVLNRNIMLVSKYNTECHISGTLSPIFGNDGSVTGVVISFRNLTIEDGQAEQIRQNHEIMLEVLRLSKIAYWEYNVADCTFWVSKEIVELYGIDEVEHGIIDGQFLTEKYIDNVKFDTLAELKDAANNKNTFRSVHEVINMKTNKPLFIDAAAAPIYNSDGEVIKFVGLTKDITEHKSLTHQLYHSQKLDVVGQLAGGIAHDFNNMLGGIIGFAELIMGAVNGNEKLEEYCEYIINTGEHAANLTSQLLSFARKGKNVSTPISIHSMIDSAIVLLTRSIDKKIKIDKQYNAPEDIIIGDPAQIESVMLNLGLNARDAIIADGEITIVTEVVELSSEFCKVSSFDIEPGNYISIKIIDNGTGMDGETIEHIFEPFFTTKGEGKGTGLGLSVIFGVVTSHNGVIKVNSELGKGTEFNIYLPLSNENEMSNKNVGDGKSELLGSAGVLLVDDEDIIRTMAKALLEDLGYTVFVAPNGQEAINIYKENINNINVVVLDVVMPVMGGMECLRKLVEINPNVKAVIASGYSRSDNSADFIANGAVDFIDKPYRQATLAKVVKSAMER